MSKNVTIVLDTFSVGDADSPDLYIDCEVQRYLDTDVGRWLNSVGARFFTHRILDYERYCYTVKLTTQLSEAHAIDYKLLWG